MLMSSPRYQSVVNNVDMTEYLRKKHKEKKAKEKLKKARERLRTQGPAAAAATDEEDSDEEMDLDGVEVLKKVVDPILGKVMWWRVILDEGHTIKNHATATATACRKLHARNRMVLTGTPIQNGADDLFSLLSFFQYPAHGCDLPDISKVVIHEEQLYLPDSLGSSSMDPRNWRSIPVSSRDDATPRGSQRCLHSPSQNRPCPGRPIHAKAKACHLTPSSLQR